MTSPAEVAGDVGQGMRDAVGTVAARAGAVPRVAADVVETVAERAARAPRAAATAAAVATSVRWTARRVLVMGVAATAVAAGVVFVRVLIERRHGPEPPS